MSSNVLATDVEGLLEEVLGETEGEVYVVNPDRETLEALVPALGAADDLSVNLLADDRVLKDVFDDFIVASTAADLMAEGRLALRVAEEPSNTLLVAGDRVVAVVEAAGRVAGLVTDDDEFVAAANEEYGDLWDDAEAFNLRTPPISRVRETLEAEIADVFSQIEPAPDAPERPTYEVPPHDETRFVVASDPETSYTTVSIIVKRDSEPLVSGEDYRELLKGQLFSSMFNHPYRYLQGITADGRKSPDCDGDGVGEMGIVDGMMFVFLYF